MPRGGAGSPRATKAGTRARPIPTRPTPAPPLAAHKRRRIHDAVIDRLRAVDGEFERLPLRELLRLLDRLGRRRGEGRRGECRGRWEARGPRQTMLGSTWVACRKKVRKWPTPRFHNRTRTASSAPFLKQRVCCLQTAGLPRYPGRLCAAPSPCIKSLEQRVYRNDIGRYFTARFRVHDPRRRDFPGRGSSASGVDEDRRDDKTRRIRRPPRVRGQAS